MKKNTPKTTAPKQVAIWSKYRLFPNWVLCIIFTIIWGGGKSDFCPIYR
jgi:hypothetical protein